jgi:hypothetical protein
MRAYMRWTSITPPQDAVALRQYRFEGLHRWRFPLVLAVLPGLLQLALLLFFCGLIDFLWHLHIVVAAIVGSFSIVFLSLALSTLVIPVFSRNSPFRSPISRTLLQTRSFLTLLPLKTYLLLVHYIKSAWSLRTAVSLRDHAEFWMHRSWEELDLRSIEANDQGRIYPTVLPSTCAARVRALHHLYTHVMDEMILETIRPCLYDVNGRRIALTNCWPIASALLGFEDVVAFNKAINRHEGSSENVPDATATMSASSRPFPRATTSMVGYSIYLRAMDMSPNIRRFLLGLIIESVLSEANSSSEKDVINAMHLLHILSVGDTGLIRQYTAMLASLVGEESSHDIISLALNHLQYAANHLNQNGWKSDGAITGGCSKVVTRY